MDGTQPRSKTSRDRSRRRRGLAMLIVMMVLLVVTASATLAVYSARFESRAVGHQRQAMQTAQLAASGIATVSSTIEMLGGARVLEFQMNRALTPTGSRLSTEEPPLLEANNRNQRFLSNEMTVAPGMPIQYVPVDTAAYGLPGFEPRFIVDVNDTYNVPATFVSAARTRVDGAGLSMQYLVGTMTSRGRMTRTGLLNASGVYSGGVFTAPEAGRAATMRRDIFETSVTARAMTMSGPYAQ